MRRFISIVPALLVLLATGAVFVAAGPIMSRIEVSRTAGRVMLAQQAIAQDDILERIDRATTAIADAVRPSVVHVEVANTSRRPFTRSNGSGWVFDAAGHIVTNAHVVRGATSIEVEFADGRIDEATVAGIDPYTDIAVLKIAPGAGVFPLARATGQPVRQGQRTFAFGSPFGFKFSMTQGIISGLGRVPGAASAFGGFSNYLQNDAAVNPGNSGGPLVNIYGEIVGMNVAIATGRDTEGSDSIQGDSAGISFAIPLETIEGVVPQLIATGRVARGFMGLSFANRPTQVTRDGGGTQTGIRVAAVVDDGPSAAAGIKAGDVIVALRGQPITEFEILRSIVGGTGAGESLPVEVIREGKPVRVNVILGQMPEDLLAQQSAVPIQQQLGMMITDGEDGPVIARVWPGYPAATLGFEPDQRIVRVGGRSVTSPIDVYIGFNEAGLLAGNSVEVVVVSGGATKSISVRLEF